MTIVEKLLQAHVAVIRDTRTATPTLGKRIADLAIRAITEGVGSPEWEAYMSLFADNKDQLNRLKAPTTGEDSYFPKGRAYIAGNGTCGADTNTFTGNGVETKIDDGLQDAADGLIVDPPGPPSPPAGTVVRPVAIPKM